MTVADAELLGVPPVPTKVLVEVFKDVGVGFPEETTPEDRILDIKLTRLVLALLLALAGRDAPEEPGPLIPLFVVVAEIESPLAIDEGREDPTLFRSEETSLSTLLKPTKRPVAEELAPEVVLDAPDAVAPVPDPVIPAAVGMIRDVASLRTLPRPPNSPDALELALSVGRAPEAVAPVPDPVIPATDCEAVGRIPEVTPERTDPRAPVSPPTSPAELELAVGEAPDAASPVPTPVIPATEEVGVAEPRSDATPEMTEPIPPKRPDESELEDAVKDASGAVVFAPVVAVGVGVAPSRLPSPSKSPDELVGTLTTAEAALDIVPAVFDAEGKRLDDTMPPGPKVIPLAVGLTVVGVGELCVPDVVLLAVVSVSSELVATIGSKRLVELDLEAAGVDWELDG